MTGGRRDYTVGYTSGLALTADADALRAEYVAVRITSRRHDPGFTHPVELVGYVGGHRTGVLRLTRTQAAELMRLLPEALDDAASPPAAAQAAEEATK